jgi:hypothetical protein
MQGFFFGLLPREDHEIILLKLAEGGCRAFSLGCYSQRIARNEVTSNPLYPHELTTSPSLLISASP